MEHIFAVGILNRYSDTKCSILVFKCCIFWLALSDKLKEKNKQTNKWNASWGFSSELGTLCILSRWVALKNNNKMNSILHYVVQSS